MTATFTAVLPLLPAYGMIFYGFNAPYMALTTFAAAIFAYSLLMLKKSPKERSLYKKAYKMQAASGFLLNIAFLLLGIGVLPQTAAPKPTGNAASAFQV